MVIIQLLRSTEDFHVKHCVVLSGVFDAEWVRLLYLNFRLDPTSIERSWLLCKVYVGHLFVSLSEQGHDISKLAVSLV